MNIRIVTFLLIALAVLGATYEASTPAQILEYQAMLLPGDTLLVLPGYYSMNWRLEGVSGTEDEPIVMKAQAGATIAGTAYDNVINIYSIDHVIIEGFEITDDNGGYGIDGIKVRTGISNVVFRGLHIHGITGVGIGANNFTDPFADVTIEDCHIHDVTGVGEGLYIGTHDGSTPVRNCIVRRNLIHDCHPAKGIQLKRNSANCTVEDNVVYSCDEAGIVLYKSDVPELPNRVSRNAVWDCGEGIFAVAQVLIESNLIFDCPYGINVRDYSGWGMSDLGILHNTVYGCTDRSIALSDMSSAGDDIVCCNNAVITLSEGTYALRATSGIGTAIVENNLVYGLSDPTGQIPGGPGASEFSNPAMTPGMIDLYPLSTSNMVDAADEVYTGSYPDFNGTTRVSPAEIGAYEFTTVENPGWQIDTFFKETELAVTEARPVPERAGLTAWPNPFNSAIHVDTFEKVTVFDLKGRSIDIITNGLWKPSDAVPSGIYILKNTQGLTAVTFIK